MDYIEPNSERWLNLDDLPEEEWRDIKDFEGLYQISNYGRVKSLSRIKKIGKDHQSSKLIGQFDLNGNLLATYYGSGDASRQTGISDVTIRQACRGGYGVKSRKGYIWKYI